MRRVPLRDLVLVAAAIAGFHALFVAFPARLARSEPPVRLLPLTAPDCVTAISDAVRPSFGGIPGGTPGNAPAGPVRR